MPGAHDNELVEILLIEDDPNDADLMIEALKVGSLTSRITVVQDGVEAMQFLRREGSYSDSPVPGLILLDLHLPRMNGHEVLTEMKSDSELRRIPIVVMTGSENENDIVEAYGLRANCCVRKPADLEAFSQAVADIKNFWLRAARRA